MTFYDLLKIERKALSQKIEADIMVDLQAETNHVILLYCSDADTYIRKAAYLSIGRLFF